MDRLLFLVLLYTISTIDGRQFRFDYDFYQEIDGWLKLHEIPATWNEARLRCHYEGAVLASPLNVDLLKSMMKVMTETDQVHSRGFYTGVHATFSKGDYSSIEGVPLSRMPVLWAPNEPDNLENSENCLITFSNGTLADVKCAEIFPYMCFKRTTANTVLLTKCGTVDTQYNLDDRTGSCYKMHTTPQTWSRAYMICAAEGGYLAIVNSDVEAQVIRELFVKHSNDVVDQKPENLHVAFIGFHNWSENGTWLTIHGETLQQAGYAKWDPNQPEDVTEYKSCGGIFSSGLLDDTPCRFREGFICEKDSDSLLLG